MSSTNLKVKTEKTTRQISISKVSDVYTYAAKMHFKSKLLLDLINKKYNLFIRDDRWQEEFICCKELNNQMDKCFITHICGSNEGSALIVKPYTSYYTDKIIDGSIIEFAKIYSDPFEFFIGDNDPMIGVDVPRKSWEEKLEQEKISIEINCSVAKYFLAQYNILIEYQKKYTDKNKLQYIENKIKIFNIDNLKRKYKL
jgi:hypothetical protein